MRETDGMQESQFTVAKLDDLVPVLPPLRKIQGLVNEALIRLNNLFNGICADSGRDSIAPENQDWSPFPKRLDKDNGLCFTPIKKSGVPSESRI